MGNIQFRPVNLIVSEFVFQHHNGLAGIDDAPILYGWTGKKDRPAGHCPAGRFFIHKK